MVERKLVAGLILLLAASAPAAATTYYVSSSSGSDLNSGLSPAAPFRTIGKVNALALSPGDQVRFRCGDEWREQPLVLRHSGTLAAPVVVTSEPTGCPDKPVLDGSRRVVEWDSYSSNIYVADLASGGNASRFPYGVNQLFRAGRRLPMGRWPNPGATADGGYSLIDSHPQGTRIVDNQLPAANWTGAAFHFKSERWYLLNREVIGGSGQSLTLNDSIACNGGCVGWGFFLNSHLATLDLDGEWFFDESANRVYLYSVSGPPADGEIAASILGAGEVEDQSGVIIGGAFTEHVQHVTIENFEIRQWAGSGIMMARLLRDDENKYISILNNTVINVGSVGIGLTTWVYEASQSGNGPDGLRGGVGCTVRGNLVDGANRYGIELHSVDSIFEDNEVRNVALIENLVREGMGCAFSGASCELTGAGIRVMLGDPGQVGYSGTGNVVQHNRIRGVGMNGVDIYGPLNQIRRNVIEDACLALADCGGIRTFGSGSFGSTGVYDNVIQENIVLDTLGNTDGVADPLQDQWGLGIYVDRYSDRIDVIGNTVVGSSCFGIGFDKSRGTVVDNTLYHNSTGTSFVSHLRLQSDPTRAEIRGNVIYAVEPDRPVVAMKNLLNLNVADENYYFSPRDPRIVRVMDFSESPMTLSEWQALSGHDASSSESWFNLYPNDDNLSEIFINDTKDPLQVDLAGVTYRDLDNNLVASPLVLQPFQSKILIRDDLRSLPFTDGFESADTLAWSDSVP